MKTIALIANSTWCLHNFRYNLMKSLLDHGCAVHVLAPLDPTYDNATFIRGFEKLGITFHEITLQPRGKNPLLELASIAGIFRALRSIKPDVVLSYTVKCNLYAGFCQRILGFEQVANVPGLGEVFEKKNVLSFVVSSLYRIAFRGMSKAFFQNREDLKYCLDRKLVPANKCVIIPGSGVDLTRFEPSYPPRRAGRRIFLMFGRLLPQKGYLEYLEAAEKLRELLGDRVECWVMGIEDKNRPESSALYQALLEAEGRGSIRMVPVKVDVVPTLNEVDTVVLPSRYNEGIPRSLLEAMATAKVIITTDWRGCRETVENGKNGYLVDVKNVPDLVQAMLKVAELDDAELAAMGRASRRLAEERYDEQVVIDNYLQVAIGYVPEPASQDVQEELVARANSWLPLAARSVPTASPAMEHTAAPGVMPTIDFHALTEEPV